MLTMISLALVGAGAAMANPISSETLSVLQVPMTQHVEVTWAVEGSVHKPGVVTRDGVELDVAWVQLDGDFKGNTGSGLLSLSATQFCDCKVDAGSHQYAVGDWQVTVEVVEDLQEQEVAGDTAMPWSVPAPVGQGIDCKATCGDATEPMPQPSCTTAPVAPAALLLLLPLLGLRRRE